MRIDDDDDDEFIRALVYALTDIGDRQRSKMAMNKL
jgi:hypothetical protein